MILSFKYGNAGFTGILDFRSYIVHVQGRVKVKRLSFRYFNVYWDSFILDLKVFRYLYFGTYFVVGVLVSLSFRYRSVYWDFGF